MTPLKLNEQEVAAWQSVMRKQTGSAAFARRARYVLWCATGARRVNIQMTLRLVAELEARVLDRTLTSKPRDGSTHWSGRTLAAKVGSHAY